MIDIQHKQKVVCKEMEDYHEKMKVRNYIEIVTLITLLITGCQSTPDQDIVANKNDQLMNQNETVMSSKTTDDSNSDKESKDSEKYSESFVSDSGDINININIDSVKAENVPIVQATAQDISVDDVKRWSKVFFGSENVYEGTNEMSKKEIQKAILEREQWINDRENLISKEGYTEEEVDSLIEMYQDEINNLKSNYASAPEDDERTKTDWTFHPGSYYLKSADDGEDTDWSSLDKTDKLKIVGDCDGNRAYIDASNRSTPDYQLHSMMFYWADEELGVENKGNPSISQEKAIQLSEEKLNELVDGEWVVNMVWSFGNQWHIQYIPVINSIPCVYSTIDYTADDMYASNLDYEQIDFTLTDEKIVSVEWDSPMKIQSTESQTIQMKSFNEIYDAFKSYMKVSSSVSSLGLMEDDSKDATITISKVQQMYCRVKEKNMENVFQYVPTYVFWGKTSVNGIEDEVESIYCIINAVDCTIINAELGY